MKLVLKQIKSYERSSGQQVNRDKSFFLASPKTSPSRINRMREATGFMDHGFPFNYLGCPIYIGRKQIAYFDGLVSKIVKRLSDSQGKILSYGGRMTLINHVLQAIPTYTLAAMCPPKGTFNLIEKYFASFFWGLDSEKSKYHWSSWNNLCKKDEGGTGMRRLVDVSNTFGKGALAKIHPCPARSHRKRVSDYITQGTWNMTKLSEVLPVTMVNHILTVPIGKHEHEDYPIWAKTEDGKFSTKTVYQKESNHSSHDILFQNIWHNKIPFKISFLAWRVLHRKLPIDELMYKFGNYVVSRCHCCNAPKCETLQLVFIDSDLVVKLWNNFGGPLGILHRKRPIRAVLQGWFGTTPVNMVWKGITSCIYGDKKKIVYSRVYHNTFWILRTTLKLAFPSYNWDQSWHKICMGGIVRDCRGNMIMTFAVPKRCSSNNMVEAHAAKYGLEWCIQQGFGDIILEIDSLIIANILIKDTVEKCKLKAIIQQTKQMLCQANVEVRHCWREANQVADGLAKHANTIQETYFVTEARPHPPYASSPISNESPDILGALY
nr:uncharacterized protein LOC117274475 [Nicotiana tomentosiformis]